MSDASDEPHPGRNFIRDRRKQLDLSQEVVGEAMGVSGMAVSRWENDGVLTVVDLNRLADVLKCAPSQLVESPPRTYQLSADEEALLLQYRGLDSGSRRSITTLARGLSAHDLDPPTADAVKG